MFSDSHFLVMLTPFMLEHYAIFIIIVIIYFVRSSVLLKFVVYVFFTALVI